jgi:hypothetical protein
MFLGEALCLFPLLLMKWRERSAAQERERFISAFDRCPISHYILPYIYSYTSSL